MPFADWYNQQLADCPFDAFFWENKPVTKQNLDETYECTIVKSSLLRGCRRIHPRSIPISNLTPIPSRFRILAEMRQLVVPCPVAEKSVYTQIGGFVRDAPGHQILDFWTRVGKEMLGHVQQDPRWLSTSGLGVYWLHVRIDSVPKYYQTETYKRL